MRRLCEDLPPIRGLVKSAPEDFEVEEVPAYLPGGEGSHLYLWVEKRGLNTQDVVQDLARLAGVPPGELGVAGQKDRQAVTRQWISLPAGPRGEDWRPEGEGWRVLDARLHGNKLRTGHLRGNRFRLRIRDAGEQLPVARQAVARLASMGLPNYYGEQRFGRGGDNADRGRALLEGRIVVKDRFRRRLLVSALQSALFNAWLDQRLDLGAFDRALAGDVLQVRASGGLFLCEAPEVDTPRVRAGELDPAGPMFGPRMVPAAGEALALEDAILEAAEVDRRLFAEAGRLAQGARRPARVPLEEAAVAAEGTDLRLVFRLPPGAYATVVLAELMGPY